MSRVALALGLAGVVALAGAAYWATGRSEVVVTAPVRNVAPPTERVRVEVLNSGGVAGRARMATLQLRDIGFDVVHYGNADRFDRERSTVVDRVGRPELARAVAVALGIGDVVSEPDPNLFVEVTVLLGAEWTGETPESEQTDSVPLREPWDPRGWIGR